MTSELYPGEIVIDDDTPEEVTHGTGFGRGLVKADGYAGAADPFPPELLIPRSEWQARIAEMEAQKSRLSDLIVQAGLPCKDQQQTNYCWINAPTHCTEIVRVLMNEPTVILSPASAGAQIKNYRNEGGWGKEGLQWIVDHGLVPVEKWPANAIDRRYATPENKQLALDYRVTEWTELQPRNLDQLVSMLLRRIPVAIGLDWWSHEVTAVDPVWLNGAIAIRPRNSWGMDYPNPGAGGFFILQGSKMYPDDAVAPRVAVAV